MAISGHRTESVFNRYAIASPDEMREAIQRTQQYQATLAGKSNIAEFPSKGAVS
jgi:hypothetical protein